jgi:hypothetical protein
MFAAGSVSLTLAQNSGWLNLDTVKAGKFDTGKMWTFENPPVNYFEQEYGFKPDDNWFDKVRLPALRFATYCSASFVSEDGLILTNHHCARQSVTDVNLEGEDLHAAGFISNSLEDERPVPGLFVDQLVLIQDVTEEIQNAMEEGNTEDEQLAIKSRIMEEIENRIAEETGLEVSITALYEGGRYSVYGYNRFTDVRLVFAPEEQLGSFGGDIDNFTYPRYCLDFSLFRVYDDDGHPLKTENYYKWSENGPEVGEPVFVVGNPGSTNRLKTVAQLEYFRDISYPRTLEYLNNLIRIYRAIIEKNPDRLMELEDLILNFTNSQKAYTGMLEGLRDPVLMHRKVNFENNFKAAVQSDEKLNTLHGGLWDKIKEIRNALRNISNKKFALTLDNFSTPEYFFIAEEVINIADELKLPKKDRDEIYSDEEIENTLNNLIPEDFDYEMNNSLLKQKLEILIKYLGGDDELVKKMTGGYSGDNAVEFILSNSSISNIENLKDLVENDPEEILNSDDPFIYFILYTDSIRERLDEEANELTVVEDSYNEKLGMALFEVYGASIPPDATFTLRLSDGVISDYPYNGTMAPTFTTFYGLYDRFYSFNKEFPWNLPERWLNPPVEFDLSTPFNFITTNDVTGGSSGSAMINKNAEVIGIAFDGNIESLSGDFIYRSEINRTVGVHSSGMLEAIKHIYKLDRIAEELTTGKLVR